MPDYETAIKNLLQSEDQINTIAIIEGKNKIVFSSVNWDISKDINTINSSWDSGDVNYLKIADIYYFILQNTPDRIIASSLNRKYNIIAIKDEERSIICQMLINEVEPSIKLVQSINVIKAITNILRSMGSKEPYMDPKAKLGKIEPSGEVSTKFLFDTTKILQRLGLQKLGLSSEEARVYLSLLKKGDKGDKVGNLNKELGIKRPTIYRIIERLIEKNWVEKLGETPKGTQIYGAKPIMNLVDKVISEKEKEIKILKSFRFLISEYINKGYDKFSQIYKDSQSFGREIFDIDVLGFMGLEKDFGIVIFEYKDIVIDEIRVRDKLDLLYGKIDQQIEKLKKKNLIPDLEDKKIEYTKIQEYFGANVYLKFKEGSKIAKNLGNGWIIAIKQVAIPIETNIYVIWGSEEKFQMLMNLVLNQS